jgi:hypothetical protein
MADRIDAVMDLVQAPIGQPPLDVPTIRAERKHLFPADPRVLAARLAGNDVEYSTHTV